jgi:hypothetical protein
VQKNDSLNAIHLPSYDELDPEIKKFIQPTNEKLSLMLAKGLAPVPPAVLLSSWAYFSLSSQEALRKASLESLASYPEKSVLAVLSGRLPHWALHFYAIQFEKSENLLEAILLNEATPNLVFILVASSCSERLTTIIANNQERIIESPEIVLALEKNPKNLKSNTDRLRQFLRLAGIFVAEPGAKAPVDAPAALAESPALEASVETLDQENLSEEKRLSLLNYINTLTTGAKVKLALKGNKEARAILVRDTNKTVSTAVLRSPRINENEIVLFSSLKHLSEDVIRDISRNPTWTKNYGIKLNLVNHPKTPLQDAMGFIKFLVLRDLNDVSRSKTVAPPIRKAAKQLLMTKRK